MLEHLNAGPTPPERVVVIGAGGFVGAAVLRNLRARGIATLTLTRREVDLLAPDAAERLAETLRSGDAVVAAAAIAPVRTPTMLRDNVVLIEAIAGALRRRPVAHLLNIGSDAVFADRDLPLTESSCRSPASLHGIMHLTRELMFAEAAGDMPFATLRPTLIYGADDRHNGYGPNRFRRLAAEGKPIVLFGNGEERRDHVWVEDVAELAVRMLLHRSTGSLNAATGEVISFREIAEICTALHRGKTRIERAPRRGPMPHNGYRAFDASATYAAFPDFIYTAAPDGLAKVHAATSKAA